MKGKDVCEQSRTAFQLFQVLQTLQKAFSAVVGCFKHSSGTLSRKLLYFQYQPSWQTSCDHLLKQFLFEE